jgi:hypothetical protein
MLRCSSGDIAKLTVDLRTSAKQRYGPNVTLYLAGSFVATMAAQRDREGDPGRMISNDADLYFYLKPPPDGRTGTNAHELKRIFHSYERVRLGNETCMVNWIQIEPLTLEGLLSTFDVNCVCAGLDISNPWTVTDIVTTHSFVDFLQDLVIRPANVTSAAATFVRIVYKSYQMGFTYNLGARCLKLTSGKMEGEAYLKKLQEMHAANVSQPDELEGMRLHRSSAPLGDLMTFRPTTIPGNYHFGLFVGEDQDLSGPHRYFPHEAKVVTSEIDSNPVMDSPSSSGDEEEALWQPPPQLPNDDGDDLEEVAEAEEQDPVGCNHAGGWATPKADALIEEQGRHSAYATIYSWWITMETGSDMAFLRYIEQEYNNPHHDRCNWCVFYERKFVSRGVTIPERINNDEMSWKPALHKMDGHDHREWKQLPGWKKRDREASRRELSVVKRQRWQDEEEPRQDSADY